MSDETAAHTADEDGRTAAAAAQNDRELRERYPTLMEYAKPLARPERTIVGRDLELAQLKAAMLRPELCNALLLAPAGAGKTTLVQALMEDDTERRYLEVDLSRMIANLKNVDELAALVKDLFDQAERYSNEEGHGLVIFMDEFHQLVQLSEAAVEGIKPVLAASGQRGLRIIVATTNEEFHKHIAPNQPLVERLQRISLAPPDEETTIAILRGMAQRYGVSDQISGDMLLRNIYEYTERHVPESSQPRKSIVVLDGMVGWHRLTKRPMSQELLADVLKESREINVAFRVNAGLIEEKLNKKVYNQGLATAAIARRLQICVADLQDHSRPMASFLLTGPTGSGKSTTVDTSVPVRSADGSVSAKRAGDLQVGDFVFSRNGEPEKILGVFPQGERDVYRVTFADGRTLDVSDNHLWAVVPNRRRKDEGFTIYSTQTLLNKGVTNERDGGRQEIKYYIPMNGAVQWPETQLPVDPYVVGAMLGNGLMTSRNAMEISSNDEITVAKIAERIGAADYKKNPANYTWHFLTGESHGGFQKNVQLREVYADLPEMVGCLSGDKSIPEIYMSASIEQRWDLVQGMFDTDGSISQSAGDRFHVSYSSTSESLVHDLQRVLYSLGVSSTITSQEGRSGSRDAAHLFQLHVKSRNDEKHRFFSLPRKLERAQRAAGVARERERMYDWVGIRSIDKLDRREEMVCIYVDHDEHLYQAGDFVVTHNTEMTKQLSRLLFGDDQRHLIRFDMAEYAEEDSMNRFRERLTEAVWNTPYSVILLDEIEKSNRSVTRLLLSVLDDGELSNRHGRTTSFLNSCIVMTTNLGSEIYKRLAQYMIQDEAEGLSTQEMMGKYQKLILDSIRTTSENFPTELINRINAVAPFQPLGRDVQRRVVETKIRQLGRLLKQRNGITLGVDDRVVRYLVDDLSDTSTDSGGARGIVRQLEDEVLAAIAAYINENPNERSIMVRVVGDLAYDNKTQLSTRARIVVTSTV